MNGTEWPLMIAVLCGFVVIPMLIVLIGAKWKPGTMYEDDRDEEYEEKVEVYTDCVVRVWTNAKTGETVTEWWEENKDGNH